LAGVLVVSSGHQLAGAEIYLLALLDGVAGSVPVEVLISDQAPPELAARLAATGARVTTVPGLARRPSAGAVLRLIRRMLRHRPDLVHVNLSDQGDGLAAIAAASLARVPLSATLHLVLPRRRRSLERLSRHALRRARMVVGVSRSVGEYLEHQAVSHQVVPNGVAAPRPQPDARLKLEAEPADLVIGGIGRLDTQKGWDILCAAAPRVRERIPGARLVVVGEGPEREALEALDSGVRFLGYRERAADLVGGMDMLVVPSRYEGFGLVAAEAMLGGIPVVAARVGALPEVIGDAGLLVPAEDPGALADALIQLAQRPELRAEMARRGRQRAESRFSPERMSEATLQVWRRAAHMADLSAPRVASSQS
jgi:glycosyltransferase involved in cell wall biosynthesis